VNTSQINVANKPKLLNEVRLTLRANYFSNKIEEAYHCCINQNIQFHNKIHLGLIEKN